MRFKKLSRPALLFAAFLASHESMGSQRIAYFSGTSTNNFSYDPSHPNEHVALLCSVNVVNMSKATQTITNFEMNSHTTQYNKINTDPTHYGIATKLTGLAHTAKKYLTAGVFNVGYLMIPHLIPPLGIGPAPNDPAPNQLTRLGVNQDLKASGRKIIVPPGMMVVIVGRTLANAEEVTLGSTTVAERKFYNTCSGRIEASDTPVAGEPESNGFLIATGQTEYIADSPSGKVMQEESQTPTWDAKLDPASTAVKGTGHSRVYLSLGIDQHVNPPFAVGTGATMAGCDAVMGVSIFARAACYAHRITKNRKYIARPQHIASIPIIINNGKPF